MKKYFKFVDDKLCSPNNQYDKIDYSNFNQEIRLKDNEYDNKEKGQCGKGIHVIPFTENIDFTNVIFSDKIIILKVKEKDIIYSEDNGKMRVKAVIPLRLANKKEKDFIKLEICKNDGYAYNYALMDKKPCKETRTGCCKSARYAYDYALNVDKKATKETRLACCKDVRYAFDYAECIDKKATKETRLTCCKDACYALHYAFHIDKKACKETRLACCKSAYYAYWYAKDIDKKACKETRTESCKSACSAYNYALNVDKKATKETRLAIQFDNFYKQLYEEEFGK